MSNPPVHEVTRLLLAWSGGAAASDPLMTAVYEKLRQLVRGYLRRERGGLAQITPLDRAFERDGEFARWWFRKALDISTRSIDEKPSA